MSIWRLFGMLFDLLIHRSRHKKSMANLRSSSARLDAHNRMMDAYRRGDYATALQELEANKNADRQGYSFFRGAFLMELGQFDEAEKLLRKNVLTETRDHQSALAYSSLGQLLLERGRYEEAMECFNASLQRMPDRGATLRDVSETWLRRAGNPAEALKWAQRAVIKDRSATALSGEVRNINLGENLATLAWAVAASSRDPQAVDKLLSEAIPLIETGAVSPAAQSTIIPAARTPNWATSRRACSASKKLPAAILRGVGDEPPASRCKMPRPNSSVPSVRSCEKIDPTARVGKMGTDFEFPSVSNG